MLTENMNHVPFKTGVYPQLKAALQDSGITPPELSEKIGVSPRKRRLRTGASSTSTKRTATLRRRRISMGISSERASNFNKNQEEFHHEQQSGLYRSL